MGARALRKLTPPRTQGVAALALSFGFVTLMKRNASFCVKASCATQVLLPLGLALLFFAKGVAGAGIGFLIASALFALVFYMWRSQLELCGRLLGVAAHALNENGHLVSATMGLSALLGVLSTPIFVFVVLATRVGSPVPNPLALADTNNSLFCVDASGAAIDCCAFQIAPAAQAYIAYAGVILSWLTFTVYEVRLFTIAHVTARWYWTPAGGKLQGSPVREAVSLATGPSSGSLAMGGALLSVADALRQSANSGRDGGSILAFISKLILSCLAGILEAFTRFTTVRLAITGEKFMDAARGVVALLSRNALNTYGVWAFPPMVIQLTAFSLSASWTGLVTLAFHAWGAQFVAHAGAEMASAQAALIISTIVVAVVAFLLCFVTISFIGSILICVVDSVYVCFAMDLDRQQVSRPEVHQVFLLVPQCHAAGSVVQQPDGEIGYAPGAQQPQRYVVSQPQYAQPQQQYAQPQQYTQPQQYAQPQYVQQTMNYPGQRL